MNFHTLSERWRLVKGLNLARTTQANYEWHLGRHIVPVLGEREIDTITEDDLLQYINTKLTELTRNAVSQQVSILRQVFEYAIHRGHLTHSPVAGLRLGARIRPVATVLDIEQVQEFLRAARRSRFYPLYVVAVFTGLRRGELIGLRWSDVDWQTRTLRVTETIVRLPLRGCEWIVKEPKSAESRRSVEVPPAVLTILRTMYDRRTPVQVRVFSQPDGRHWSVDHIVAYDLPRVCARAGIPPIRLHDLRHTHATLLLSRRFNPRAVQKRLGHANVAFLLSAYAHVLPSDGKEMADELQKVLSVEDGLP